MDIFIDSTGRTEYEKDIAQTDKFCRRPIEILIWVNIGIRAVHQIYTNFLTPAKMFDTKF